MNTLELLKCSPVMPVIVIQDVDGAVHLARALVAGNIRTLEVTLRSDVALAAIRAIRDQVPEALVGAGTVRTARQLDAALEAGAQFAISPGLTPELSKAAQSGGIPFLPGVATASEAMRAADQGFLAQKLFPAEAVGGTALLKAWHGPLPDLVFCPTGGIHTGNMGAYLSLPNVECVGGSWLTPKQAMHDAQWQVITELARQACKIAEDCKP
ncbi:MAG TPA: bifunctional 4-hydroxy-2-oxoglutarate aldolase/2-dehydro-3-deoxy-phosphogluconate aldolase [Castellaniella sp.]|jgi:2-dehydro-3-deoxyphosphogluconate aldolase/(4S)-4-hydroxy-2-oxoglutarate aldolase|nr:bifunctional 4-hydroxy-2-oxoglutarate aldolase/2-dehydro-3-deoxy-phosphogluconate aldolase [Castellaniella sp.]